MNLKTASTPENLLTMPDGNRYELVDGQLVEKSRSFKSSYVAPDLAVEVVSPNDSYYDVEAKIVDLLSAGVKVIWVMNPDNRTARIFRADGVESTIREDEFLTAEDVLPGFSCRLADLFQPPTSHA